MGPQAPAVGVGALVSLALAHFELRHEALDLDEEQADLAWGNGEMGDG